MTEVTAIEAIEAIEAWKESRTITHWHWLSLAVIDQHRSSLRTLTSFHLEPT
jgi:hypothetical protein